MRDWLLELGHSRLKLGRAGVAARVSGVVRLTVAEFPAWLDSAGPGAEDRFWLAAVPASGPTAAVRSALADRGLAVHAVTTGCMALDVAAAYPGLGVDRWLAMQSAWAKLRAACCIVDAGTATTIDIVDARGRHHGGWILPGVDASRSALLARAPVLRRDPAAVDSLGPASATADALERGLVLQQAGAIERALREAGGKPLQLLLTGGAARPLQSWLEGARLEPDLVLEGLAIAVERSKRS